MWNEIFLKICSNVLLAAFKRHLIHIVSYLPSLNAVDSLYHTIFPLATAHTSNLAFLSDYMYVLNVINADTELSAVE